jgi:hypothetical protein
MSSNRLRVQADALKGFLAKNSDFNLSNLLSGKEIEVPTPEYLPKDIQENLRTKIPFIAGSVLAADLVRRLLYSEEMIEVWPEFEKKSINALELYWLLQEHLQNWSRYPRTKLLTEKKLSAAEEEIIRAAKKLSRKIRYTPFDLPLTGFTFGSYASPTVAEFLHDLSALTFETLARGKGYKTTRSRPNQPDAVIKTLVVEVSNFFRETTNQPHHRLNARLINALTQRTDPFSDDEIQSIVR